MRSRSSGNNALVAAQQGAAVPFPQRVPNLMSRHGGIFGENGRAWRHQHRSSFQSEFDAAKTFVEEWYSVVKGREIPRGDEKAFVATTLYFRALEHFQAAVLIVEHGLVPPARAAVRNLVEVAFAIRATMQNPEILRRYLEQHEKRRLKMMNKAMATSAAELGELRRRAKAEPRAAIRQASATIPSQSLEDLSKEAGLHDEYLTIYTVLSDMAHPNAKGLEHYKKFDTAENVWTIDGRPSSSDTLLLLGTATHFMILVASAYADAFCIDLDDVLERQGGTAREWGTRSKSDGSA